MIKYKGHYIEENFVRGRKHFFVLDMHGDRVHYEFTQSEAKSYIDNIIDIITNKEHD